MRALRATLRSGAATALAALFFALTPAQAEEPTAGDKAMAEALFRAGRELVDGGKVAEGCPKLEESYRLEPKTGTLLNIALCHEQLGKTASAWAELIEVTAQARRLKQDDRVAFATERAKALEKKLSRVTLTAPAPDAGLVVSLDGKAVGSSVFGVPMPLDPGEHRVQATAPGKAPFTLAFTVAPGPSSKTVEIPALGPETAPTGTLAPTGTVAPTGTLAPAQTSAPTATLAPTAASPGVNGMFAGGLVASGVGLIGLVVGGVFGGLTLSKESDAKAICPDKLCPTQEGLDLHNEARGLSTVSTVGFGVGIAGAGVGLTLLLLSRSSAAPAKTGARPWISPSVGPGAAGITGGARF